MPSSISSSDRKAARSSGRAIAGLLATLVAILISMEATARLGFERTSKIERRMHEERALAMRALRGPAHRPTMLLVGNSVVLEGIDFPLLHGSLAPGVEAFRYVVEQTTYYDWYYGLRRLFAEGIRPTYLVVGFSAPHLNGDGMRGDYAAHYLFDFRGLIDYARQAHLDATTASGLVFAHFSEFYATRAELRAFLMNRFFPSYGAVLHELMTTAAPDDTDEHVAMIARERLRALDELAREYGTKFIFLITPTGQAGENGILSAGRMSGTTVLLPLPNERLGPADFRDGFHLNERGRALFTEALIAELKAQTERGPQQAVR